MHEQVAAAALEGAAANVWLVPLLPFLAFLIISFLTRPWGRVSAAVSILALTGSLGVSAQVFWQRFTQDGPPMQVALPWITLAPDHPLGTIELGLLVDNLSAMMLLMVCFVGLCIQIYSTAYIQTEIAHFPTQGSASMSRFFGWMSLFTFSMLGLVLSHNLLEIYIFWELVGLCSYLLIGFWYFKHSAAEACKKAFVVTRFGDLGFLMGILMLGVALKGFDFLGLTERFAQGIPQGLTAGFVALAAVLIFCGAIGKSAQFPLQIWLPDAMEGPTPVSALIHAATMVAAGVYLVARLFPVFHPAGHAGEAALIVAWIGGVTAFLAATIAVVQNDIKRVLAYSTISQLGFMMAGLGMGAYTAGSFHLITHAFFKSLLFLGSGAVIVACHSNDLWRMGGLRRQMPFTWFAFLMGCLALAGVPPLAGFWSKDEILGYVHAAPGGMALYLLLTFSAFLTAFYVTRMYFLAFEGPYRGVEKAPAPRPWAWRRNGPRRWPIPVRPTCRRPAGEPGWSRPPTAGTSPTRSVPGCGLPCWSWPSLPSSWASPGSRRASAWVFPTSSRVSSTCPVRPTLTSSTGPRCFSAWSWPWPASPWGPGSSPATPSAASAACVPDWGGSGPSCSRSGTWTISGPERWPGPCTPEPGRWPGSKPTWWTARSSVWPPASALGGTGCARNTPARCSTMP